MVIFQTTNAKGGGGEKRAEHVRSTGGGGEKRAEHARSTEEEEMVVVMVVRNYTSYNKNKQLNIRYY